MPFTEEELNQMRERAAALRGTFIPPPPLPPQPVTQQGPPISAPGRMQDHPYLMAQSLEDQAKPPAQPQGLGTQLLRSAFEGLAATGHPGGYYGWQADRQAQERQREQDLLARAKQYRDMGMEREKLNMEAGRYQNEADWRQNQANITEKHYQDEAAHQREQERLAAQNAANKVEFAPPGSQPFKGGQPYGQPIPKESTDSVDKVEMVDWLRKNPGKTPSDYGAYKATLTKSPSLQFGDDPNNPGKQIPYEYDPLKHTVTPVQGLTRTPAATMNAEAKAKAADEGIMKSVTALENLAKENTYIADVAMADQFFNVVKPDSGARMNQSYIDRLMTPGPLKNKMTAWAQRLAQGQLLTPEDRQYMIGAAHAVADAKKNPGGSTPAGGWKVISVK